MLTDAKVRTARAADGRPVRHADGRGLILEVRPNGAKLWRLRYRLHGKENLYAIGAYPEVKLAEAREARDSARALIKQGINPAHHRQTQQARAVAEAANTFEGVALEWIAMKRPNWAPYYTRQVDRFMASDVFPKIGALPIRSVGAHDVLAILKAAEKRGAKTVAILIRQWCSAIFRYATGTLRADSDPAAALRGAIERDTVKHRPALKRAQLGELLAGAAKYSGHPMTRIAMLMLAHTFVRTAELRAAEWCEFDTDQALWRIPASRMKKRRDHLVPLSAPVLELLEELRKITGAGRYLFPNQRRRTGCMSSTTLNRALERMGFAGKGTVGFSGHAFRSTASTLLNELGYRADGIEVQLAHVQGGVRGSYNAAEYLEERRTMMADWSRLLCTLQRGGDVIPLQSRRASVNV